MTESAIDPDDTQCLRCGYNLRGLATTANCPECGLLVSASLENSLLVRGRRENYYKGIRTAMLFLQLSVILAVTQMIVSLLFSNLYFRSDVRTILYFLPLPMYVGTWWLTRMPGDRFEPEFHRRIRLAIRVAIVILAGGEIVSAVLDNTPVAVITPLVLSTWRVTTTLADVARRSLTIVFLILLARNIGQKATTKFATVMLPMVVLACIGELATNLLFVIAFPMMGANDPFFTRLYAAAAMIHSPVELLFAVGYFILLLLMRRRLREQLSALGM